MAGCRAKSSSRFRKVLLHNHKLITRETLLTEAGMGYRFSSGG